MPPDVTSALLNQLLGHALLLKSDEAEVLGHVVLALVDGSDDLADGAVLAEVLLDLVLTHPVLGKLADINLTGLNVCLLDSDTFPLKIEWLG